MTPFAARCTLVGAAVVLVAFGVVAPIGGSSRAVLIGAGACCALIDVVLVRAMRNSTTDDRVAVIEPPRPATSADATDPETAEQARSTTSATTADGAAPTSATTAAGAAPTAVPSIVLGHDPDGRLVELHDQDDGGPTHVVVIGTGAVAVAVFRAVAEQLRRAATRFDGGTRAACDPELRAALGLGSGTEPCPPLPEDLAVVTTVHPDGGITSTAVLVPGSGQLPRRWNVAVEVTRYGCTVRRPAHSRGVALSPVLPELAPLR